MVRKWSKEDIDEFFEKNIKQYIVDNTMVKRDKLRELGFNPWVDSINTKKYGYTGLKDFAEKHGYNLNSAKKWSKEAIADYFEKNIKQHIKGNTFLKQEELLKLGFGGWYMALNRISHTGLKDFAEGNGYILSRYSTRSSTGLYKSKEKLDYFFYNKILPHFKTNNITYSYIRRKIKGGQYWLMNLKKHNYINFEDYCIKNNIKEYIPYYKYIKGIKLGSGEIYYINGKLDIDEFYYKYIKPHFKESESIGEHKINKLGYGKWISNINSGKYGYKGIVDFYKKNGIKVNVYKRDIAKYNSKEKIDKVFIERIKPKMKGKFFLKEKEIKKLGLGAWLQALHKGVYGYTGLQDFISKNGYLSSGCMYNSKEKLDGIFKDLINSKENLNQKFLKKIGIYGFYQALKSGKYGYSGIEDFIIKNNL